LREFDWKGNVRELKNLIERAVLIAKGPELTLEDLSIQVPEPSGKFNLPQQGTPFVIPEEGVDLPSILESVEKEYIKEALRITGGNETRAAELLNLNYTTFRYRKKNYG